MATKIIINDKPQIGDKGIYNFSDDYNEAQVSYDDSTGLPQNNDQFQQKDLFTKVVGNKINEDIIEKNIKFQGNPSIKIENLYVANAGVGGTVKNVAVKIYMFSQAAYGSDPTQDGYSAIKSKINANSSNWKIYDEGFGNQSEGSDIGNISNVEGVDIVSNFDTDSTQISIGDIPGRTLDFEVDEQGNPLNNIKAFKLSDLPDDDLQTLIFNQQAYNPIYIVVLTLGNKKVAWPIKTDSRKKKYSIFKISNDDLFIKSGNNFVGTNYLTNFTSPSRVRTGEGGGGATKSAWKVTSLQIRINTLPGVSNNFSDASEYQQSIDQVLPRIVVNQEIFNSVDWLGLLNPKNQLDNEQLVEYRTDVEGDELTGARRHIDFIPFTNFGISQNNQLPNNFTDLQSYYTDLNDIAKASSPLNVTFTFDIKDINGNDFDDYEGRDNGPNEYFRHGDRVYYYFVIDWNDTKDRFKTIDDWLDSKPENTFDYLELQNQNLYKVRKFNKDKNQYDELLSNVYTTPGIKNVKIIMFSVYEGGGNTHPNYSPDFEVGRWKLITSRIYLDIPPTQYPDFSDVGGSEYSTIPWPYTTAIIGGVSENSKYKTSVQKTLSSGKIGQFDIIDEKFLINDLQNDELGKSIIKLDLEQCRYFNTSYSIYDLLNINAIQNNQIISFDNYDGEVNKFPEESSVGQIFITDNQDKDLKQSCKLELNTGELTDKTILDTSGNANKGLLIGDYKVKKNSKGQPMRRDSFIKVAKKTDNSKGAL